MSPLPATILTLLASAVLATAAEVVPIVEVESDYLVGAYASGKWLVSEKAAKLVKAGLPYRVYSLAGELGAAKGGAPKPGVDVCPEVFTVALSPKDERGTIAIAAPWNPLPRKPQLGATTQPVYLEAARQFLQSRGIKDPKVKLTKIVRIDLDGDGEEEVLLSATNYFTKDHVPPNSPAGSYSFVLLRRVVDGKVRTQLLEGDFYPKAKTFNAPAAYEITAVLDVDGDGRMEVFVNGSYYEGGWTTIYRCTHRKIEELLVVSCGV